MKKKINKYNHQMKNKTYQRSWRMIVCEGMLNISKHRRNNQQQ